MTKRTIFLSSLALALTAAAAVVSISETRPETGDDKTALLRKLVHNADRIADASEAGGGDVTAADTFGTDNALIRADGTGKGVQSSAWQIGDNGEAAAELDGDDETALLLTLNGTNAFGVSAATDGTGATALSGQVYGVTSVAVRGVAQASGSVGVYGQAGVAGAVPLRINNENGYAASFTFAGTASRAIVWPDEAGTVALKPKAEIPVAWVAPAGGGLVSGTAATNLIGATQACQIYFTGAITGVSRMTLHTNSGTSYPFTMIFPGSRVATASAHASATMDWDQPWEAHWQGTNYMGANGAEQNVQFGCNFNSAAAALATKGVRVKFTATGAGAGACTVAVIAHNGTSEITGALTGTMSGGDYTLNRWRLEWKPADGFYLYINGTLLASRLLAAGALPSGTGTAGNYSCALFVGAAGADAAGTIQYLRILWR